MERLALLAVGIVVALIAIQLNLTYVGLAVLIGIAMPVFSIVRGSDTFSSAMSAYVFVVIGFGLLVLAYFICDHYGIPFETLDEDRSFPRVIRRLPYFGIVFLTSGCTAMAIAIFRRQRTTDWE
jgi:hypothetical protein